MKVSRIGFLFVLLASSVHAADPPPSTYHSRRLVDREVHLAPRGPGNVTDRCQVRGPAAAVMVEAWKDDSPDELKKRFDDYGDQYFGEGRLTRHEVRELDVTGETLAFTAEFEDVEIAKTSPSDATVEIRTHQLLLGLPVSVLLVHGDDGFSVPPLRGADLILDKPFTRELRVVAHPPRGYEPAPLPESRQVRMAHATLDEAYRLGEDGTIHATLRFDSGTRPFSPQEAQEVSKGLLALFKAKGTKLRFQHPGEVALKEGRIRDAYQGFLRIVAKDPAEPSHKERIVRALLAAGLGEGARTYARKIVAEHPESPLGHASLGNALAYDPLGRKKRAGFDQTGSAAAYRTALRLAPDDYETRRSLAYLLIRGKSGRPWSRGAPLTEAVEMIRECLKRVVDAKLPNTLMVTLFYAGRLEEAAALAGKDPSAGAAVPILVAVRAVLEGTDAAMAEAGRLTTGDDRKKFTNLAGHLLSTSGRYTEAAALYRALLVDHPGDKFTALLFGFADGITRRDQIDTSFDTPEGVVRRFFTVSMPGTARDDELRALFASEVRTEDCEVFRRGSRRGLDPYRGVMRMLRIEEDQLVDLFLSNASFTPEGDGDHGYRVAVSAKQGAKMNQFLFAYVVQEDGSFRLLAVSGAHGAMGARILALIEAGKQDAARRWLDWATDEIPATRFEDPLSLRPFRRLWGPDAETDRDGMRTAAAALLIGYDTPRGKKILEEALSVAPEEERAFALRAVLLSFAQAANDPAQVVELARALLDRHPDSDQARRSLYEGLRRLGNLEELEALLGARRKAAPDSTLVHQLTVALLRARGDGPGYEAHMRARLESGSASGEDLNSLAWYHLCQETLTEESLTLAERAVRLAKPDNKNALHTLAAVQAELGRPKDAMRTLGQLVDKRGHLGVEAPEDWYVFGRIAESYGATDAARDAYRRVTLPEWAEEDALLLSCHALAARRLEALE